MTDPNELKAKQKIEEGVKKLKKGSGFFSSVFGGEIDISDAIACFVNAANLYKTSKNWHCAGDTFVRIAELQLQHGDSKFDAAQNYCEAGICYRKVDITRAEECYTKADDIFLDMGKFNMAAKCNMTMGEIFESAKALTGTSGNVTNFYTKEQCIEKCINFYQKAADYYKGEEQKSSASKCLCKVAEYSAEAGQYHRAMLTYEEIGIYETENSMLKYHSRTSFLKALLCAMCYDSVEARRALRRYIELSKVFEDSKECKLIIDLLNHVENHDPDGFAQSILDYEKVSRFDNWHTSILLKIKKTCGDGGEVQGDGGAEEDEDLR